MSDFLVGAVTVFSGFVGAVVLYLAAVLFCEGAVGALSWLNDWRRGVTKRKARE